MSGAAMTTWQTPMLLQLVKGASAANGGTLSTDGQSNQYAGNVSP